MREITPTSLVELVTPAVAALGYELWGLVVQPNKGSLLIRVYIDQASGITVDDCEAVSHQISGVFEVAGEGALPASRYTLEVSSPGLDRPLFSLDQYQRFVNYEVRVRLKKAIQQQRNFQGKLQAVQHQQILLQIADQSVEIDFSNIERGNVVPHFSR